MYYFNFNFRLDKAAHTEGFTLLSNIKQLVSKCAMSL